jgi:pheromone shutdown protein TraB
LRAAHYALAHASRQPKFLLFPMLHIGSSDYYAQVRTRLKGCDLILFEGVRTFSGQILTLAYRLVARRKRLNLVVQNVALPLKGLAPRLICADVSSGEFEESWASIPWHLRLTLVLGAPIFGAYQYLTATRESIGKRLSTEDVQSHEDTQLRERNPEFHKALLDHRDAKLTAAVEAVLAETRGPAVVGIIYGARHIRSVTDLLMNKFGFRVAHAEWLNVFDYADV